MCCCHVIHVFMFGKETLLCNQAQFGMWCAGLRSSFYSVVHSGVPAQVSCCCTAAFLFASFSAAYARPLDPTHSRRMQEAKHSNAHTRNQPIPRCAETNPYRVVRQQRRLFRAMITHHPHLHHQNRQPLNLALVFATSTPPKLDHETGYADEAVMEGAGLLVSRATRRSGRWRGGHTGSRRGARRLSRGNYRAATCAGSGAGRGRRRKRSRGWRRWRRRRRQQGRNGSGNGKSGRGGRSVSVIVLLFHCHQRMGARHARRTAAGAAAASTALRAMRFGSRGGGVGRWCWKVVRGGVVAPAAWPGVVRRILGGDWEGRGS